MPVGGGDETPGHVVAKEREGRGIPACSQPNCRRGAILGISERRLRAKTDVRHTGFDAAAVDDFRIGDPDVGAYGAAAEIRRRVVADQGDRCRDAAARHHQRAARVAGRRRIAHGRTAADCSEVDELSVIGVARAAKPGLVLLRRRSLQPIAGTAEDRNWIGALF
jgi:hypothetical protein